MGGVLELNNCALILNKFSDAPNIWLYETDNGDPDSISKLSLVIVR